MDSVSPSHPLHAMYRTKVAINNQFIRCVVAHCIVHTNMKKYYFITQCILAHIAMKELFIIDLNEREDTITYNDIIRALVKGHELNKHNTMLRINDKLIYDPEIYKMCRKRFDHIIKVESEEQKNRETKRIQEKYGYTDTKKINMIKMSDDKMDQLIREVKNAFGTHFMFKERDILRGHYDHENYKEMNQGFRIYQMFNDVKEYEYQKPTLLLKKYYGKNTYYHRLYDDTKNDTEDMENKKMRLSANDNIELIEKDMIMLQYLKCRPMIKTMILWKPWIHELDKIIKILEKDHNVYYVKTIGLTYNGLQNLVNIINPLLARTKEQRSDESQDEDEDEDEVNKKMKMIDLMQTNNPICFIIYEAKDNNTAKNDYPITINGPLSLSAYWCWQGIDNNAYDVSESFCQAIEQGELLLNNNSIRMIDTLKQEEVDQIDKQKIQNMRKTMYNEMSLLEMDRLMITDNDNKKIEYVILDTMNIKNKQSRSNYREDDFKKRIEKTMKRNKCVLNKSANEKINEERILDPRNYYYYGGIKRSINNEDG